MDTKIDTRSERATTYNYYDNRIQVVVNQPAGAATRVVTTEEYEELLRVNGRLLEALEKQVRNGKQLTEKITSLLLENGKLRAEVRKLRGLLPPEEEK